MSTSTALQLVTNSEIKTYRRCAREHHYAYRLGYRPTLIAEALRVGSLLHLGLEAYWRHWEYWATDSDQALFAAWDAMRPWAIDGFDAARAEQLMRGYHARWQGQHRVDAFEVLGVELEFRAPLVNPATSAASRTFELGGKLDALIRRSNGRVYLVEHKTTSEDIGAGSTYWQRLQLDAQVSMYYAGARSLGYDVAGCDYDVVGKPKIRPLKATPLESRQFKRNGELYANQRAENETVEQFEARLTEEIAANGDRYYQRGVVVRLDAEERDAGFDVWQVLRVMRESELAQRYPRNPEACMRWGRACDYFGVCTGTATLDDPHDFRHVEHVHEELSAGAP